MAATNVQITGEWFPDPDAGVRRVAKGIFPECRVNDVPVLVIWGGVTVAGSDHGKILRAFREVVGGDGILVVAGPEGGDGWLRVDTSLSSPQRDAAILAAAVAKYSWGWDEANAIRIGDQRGTMLVAVEFDASESCFHASLVAAENETLHAFFGHPAAERWSFDRKDGVHCEGYVVELEADRVLFGYGGPLAPDEPEWLSFDAIGNERLSYWNDRAKRWTDFPETK